MKTVTNFGRNVRFTPRRVYAPRDEAALLRVLDGHSSGKIRVAGSLHSWSDVVETDDVLVDMRYFGDVRVEANGREVWARVGGGCRIKHLLDRLRGSTGATLPTVGAITEQTIAGAISTATHGSGKHSLSHYVQEVRLAAYDAADHRARIYQWTEGPELRAARCALGFMGTIVEVRLRCVPDYLVSETLVACGTIEEVLDAEDRFPLQQFVLVPYLWSYVVFRRRMTRLRPSAGGRVSAWIYRIYKRTVIDFAFHLVAKLLASPFAGSGVTRWFYRKAFTGLLPSGRTFTDRSRSALTLKHDLFRHLEMEVFVPARHLVESTELVQAVISTFSGISEPLPPPVSAALERIGMLATLLSHAGSYTHHYPVFFRRVLPDDTLISMTSGSDEPYYTMSFFTYQRQRERGPFFVFAGFLARCLTRLYAARLHWGKYLPLTCADIEELYPRLEEFRRRCRGVDPEGVFRNSYAERVLGFGDRRSGSGREVLQETI